MLVGDEWIPVSLGGARFESTYVEDDAERERIRREEAEAALANSIIPHIEINGKVVDQEMLIEAQEIVRRYALATREAEADDYQRARARDDMKQALATWALLSRGERKNIGLPETADDFAQAWNISTSEVYRITRSPEFNRDYLVNGKILDDNRAMVEEVRDILLRDLREGGAPAKKAELLFKMAGLFVPVEERPGDSRQGALAESSAEDMAERWAEKILATADMQALNEALGGYNTTKAMLRQRVLGALTEVFGGARKERKRDTPKPKQLEAGRYVREHFHGHRSDVEDATVIEG